jgi:predicted secreted protein
MAQPKVPFGTKLRIKVSDGTEPTPNFELICGLTTKTFSQSKEMNDFHVPDCDEPEKIVAVQRRARTKALEISGSGIFNPADRERLQGFFDDETPRRLRIELDVPLADGGGHWSGDFHMSQFTVTGDDEGLMTADMTFLSDGEWGWTDASA